MNPCKVARCGDPSGDACLLFETFPRQWLRTALESFRVPKRLVRVVVVEVEIVPSDVECSHESPIREPDTSLGKVRRVL